MKGLKEHFLDKSAERYQEAGFAVLVYDQRNWGASDGHPRYHSNHYEQIQDVHDAVYFARTRPEVDSDQIALWGSSFSGGAAIIAGATDIRVKAVITQVPFVSGRATREALPEAFLQQIYEDRGANSLSEPTYIPARPSSIEQAQQRPTEALLGTEETWNFSLLTKNLGPKRDNKISLQTLFHAMHSEPRAYVAQLSPKPFFMAIGRNDSLIDSRLQKKVFDEALEPKELLDLDTGHFGVYTGEIFEVNVAAQIKFLKSHFKME